MVSEDARTFQSIVYPYQCDAMGHMTIQYYVAAFDQAFWSFMYATGWRPEPDRSQRGFADVRHLTNFHSELGAGEPYHIFSRVVSCGRSSLTTLHQMFNSADDALAADLEMTSVHFDLVQRRSTPLPDDFRVKVLDLASNHDTATKMELG